MTVQKDGNEITLSGKGHTVVLTINSNLCTKNGTSVTIQGAPFEENGILYLPATDLSELFTRRFTYDSIARVIKLK